MIRELKIHQISWISLVKPATDDIRELGFKFPQIHPLVLEELLTPTIRPRVENYDHHLYMVLHFTRFVSGPEKSVSFELDLILLKDALITVQYGEIMSLEEFWHECEARTAATERYGKNPIHLLYYLLRLLFSHALRELDQIQIEIDGMEEKVFKAKSRDLLEEITLLKRDILDFRRAFKPQHLTLESLIPSAVELYGEKVRPFVSDLVGEYLKVWNLLETHKETLDALYDTNRQLLAARTNEIMKVFTILAFISFIPTVIANLYGMNIPNLPLADRSDAFWAIILMMIGFTGAVYAVLKLKKLV